MTAQTVAAALSGLKMQIDNCIRSNNVEWRAKAEARRSQIVRDFLPNGSGIDSGSKIETISDERIVISCSFHHMDENGYYDGWTDHKITIRSGFYLGFVITVSGRDRNEIKDYLAETYRAALGTRILWSEEKSRYVRCTDDT